MTSSTAKVEHTWRPQPRRPQHTRQPRSPGTSAGGGAGGQGHRVGGSAWALQLPLPEPLRAAAHETKLLSYPLCACVVLLCACVVFLCACVIFCRAAESDRALRVLRGGLWKGLLLSVCLARPSRPSTEYRHKCEYLVGIGVDGEDNSVSCRLSKYKGGACAVAAPYDTLHILGPPSRG
ncbi:hypothetical protein CB1_000288010 [Camelus ferus]|nr:hypothetical protein CB1_000288010 [Camelus ferus]